MRSRIDVDWNMPLEFILEGSNDDISWKFLHHKERNNELKTKDSKGNWTIDNNNKLFRSFRITQIGENYHIYGENEKYIFAFNKIELFGTLVPASKHTCMRVKSSLSSHLKMMNVMLADQEASVVH